MRAQIVPSRRGAGASHPQGEGGKAAQPVSMTWAQRLKRVFGIDIDSCEHCGGAVKIIASIEDPEVIEAILTHERLQRTEGQRPTSHPPVARGPRTDPNQPRFARN